MALEAIIKIAKERQPGWFEAAIQEVRNKTPVTPFIGPLEKPSPAALRLYGNDEELHEHIGNDFANDLAERFVLYPQQ